MKTLRDFLLAEVKLHEAPESETGDKGKRKNKQNAPEGFKALTRSGNITDELKEILKIDKAKELDLRHANKISKNLKVSSIEGRKEIISDLGLSGTDAISIIEQVMTSDLMSEIFTGKPFKKKKTIEFKLINSYGQLAGRTVSSLKFIKFWIECACIAVGISDAPKTLQFYVEHDGKNYGNTVIVKKL